LGVPNKRAGLVDDDTKVSDLVIIGNLGNAQQECGAG